MWRHDGGRLSDHRHGERRVDRRRLARFEIGKTLNIGVEPLSDFFNGGFHERL
jgi:hypothetical protein